MKGSKSKKCKEKELTAAQKEAELIVGSAMTMPEIIKHNAAQESAVSTTAKTVRVLAGPGTGKTRVLIDRVASLVQRGVAPYEILAVTFTNKAANELKTRLRDVLGGATIEAGTFHGVLRKVLRRDIDQLDECPIEPGFHIYDEPTQIALMKMCIKEIHQLDIREFKPKDLLAVVSKAKNDRKSIEEVLGPAKMRSEIQQIEALCQTYAVELARRNAVDFDDILLLSAELFEKNDLIREKYRRRWPHVCVDEFQDTNRLQFDVLQGLVGDDRGSIFIVGDPDQGIYGWRGADDTNLAKFDAAYRPDDRINLKLNYRSSQWIIDAASAVVRRGSLPRENLEATTEDIGSVKRVHVEDQDAEARFVAESIKHLLNENISVGILYRTNAQSSFLENELLRRSIKFTMARGRRFFERKEIMDALAYLRLVHDPRDDMAFERIVNVPPRGVGPKSVEILRMTARDRGVSISDAVANVQGIRSKPKQAIDDLLSDLGDLRTEFQTPAPPTADWHVDDVMWKENSDIDDFVAPRGTVAWLLQELLIRTKYYQYVLDLDNADERCDHLRQLVSLATPFGTDLQSFLDDCALLQADDDDDPEDDEQRATVVLSTVHAAKGLEFNVVFVTGCEDHLFPHSNTRGQPDEENLIDVERRLLYVAMSRAKRHLYLVHAKSRLYNGSLREAGASRFLADIVSADVPIDYLDLSFGGSSKTRAAARGSWRRPPKNKASSTAESLQSM